MESLNKTIKWLCMMFIVSMHMPLLAQDVDSTEPVIYTGLVKNKSGQGIEGVAVTIQESKESTITDDRGNFSITADNNSVLIFKKDGFLTARYSLPASTGIEVTLQEAKILAGDDDYVEIPFGRRQKRYLT